MFLFFWVFFVFLFGLIRDVYNTEICVIYVSGLIKNCDDSNIPQKQKIGNSEKFITQIYRKIY